MTERLSTRPEDLRRAAEFLRRGGLVAFGTETVYGLGALSTCEAAVSRIFAVKGRPSFNPLIHHFSDAESAFAHVDMSTALGETARRLAARFWPGPMSLILPRAEDSPICLASSAGLPSLALRVPRGEAVREMLRQAGGPVAAPSANLSGMISPSTAAHVLQALDGKIEAVVDTGPCPVGVESTVIDLTGQQPVLLRPGGITLEALTASCGPFVTPSAVQEGHSPQARPLSPGQLLSHYAPSLPVRLQAAAAAQDEALLAFGPHPPPAGLIWNLSEKGDLEEAASRLFAGLHFLDTEGRKRKLKRIAVQEIPAHGLGLAIRDRLNRAAAPRPSAQSD